VTCIAQVLPALVHLGAGCILGARWEPVHETPHLHGGRCVGARWSRGAAMRTVLLAYERDQDLAAIETLL